MVRAPQAFRQAAAPYVPVRVTDMRNVDIDTIRFDFDLTMAIVLMHSDGTIYHRYGSRDAASATSWTSIEGLCRLLDESLPEHAAYDRAAGAPKAKGRRPIDLAPLQRRLAKGKVDCIHCHTVHDTEHQLAIEERRLRPDAQWLYPDPARVGLVQDVLDQALVSRVIPGSPAASTGIQAGDRLLSLGRQTVVRTIADLMWALDGEAPTATSVAVAWTRNGEAFQAPLELSDGWKESSPTDYAWRPYKWSLSPAPGFGGPMLDSANKRKLKIDEAVAAFRVQYMVTWGERSHRGRAAAAAGLRVGDVVLSFAGKDDFEGMDHFHAWVRLRCTVGQEVEIVVLRSGERHTLSLPLPK